MTFGPALTKNFTLCWFYSLWKRTAKFSLRASKIMKVNEKNGPSSAVVMSSVRGHFKVKLSFIPMKPDRCLV